MSKQRGLSLRLGGVVFRAWASWPGGCAVGVDCICCCKWASCCCSGGWVLGELVQVGLWCLEWVQRGWRVGLLHQVPLLEL